MKLLLCFLILVIAVNRVSAIIENCKETTDCSEEMRNKCKETSETLEDGLKAILTCKSGICMCNIQFSGHVAPQVDQSCEKKVMEEKVMAETTTAVNAEDS